MRAMSPISRWTFSTWSKRSTLYSSAPSNVPTYEVTAEEVSVASRIQFLKNLLLSEDQPVSLREVFERQPSLQALIATFLAMLELVRMRAIVLRQKKLFDKIIIRKHKMFDAVFSREESFFDVAEEYQA